MPRPKKEKKQEAQKISQEEYEKKIIELSEKGLTSEKIGEALRRQRIHPKEHKKKISIVLKEKNLYINPDIQNIEKKLRKIRSHSEKYKQDKRAMREKERVYAQLRKLKKYFNMSIEKVPH